MDMQQRRRTLVAAYYRGQMTVYLAAPFFNDSQRAWITTLETLLGELGITYFSPSRECLLNAERTNQRECFNTDLEGIAYCSVVLARVDDFDAGTMWEWGYCWGQGKMVLAYTTENDRGLNVMLAMTARAFLRGLPDIRRALTVLRDTGEVPEDLRPPIAKE